MPPFHRTCALLALLILPLNAAAAGDLRPRFEAGRELRYAVTLVDSMQVSTKAGGPSNSFRRELTIAFSILESGGESTRAELRFERIAIRQVGAAEGDFDSSADKPDRATELGRAFRPLVNLPLILTIDAAGAIRAVGGADRASFGGRYAEDAAALITRQGLQSLLAPLLTMTRPSSSDAPGTTWSASESIRDAPFGEITVRTDYRVAEFAGAIARIAVSGDFSLAPAKGAEGVSLKTTAFSGDISWDAARGCPAELRLERAFTVEMTARGETAAMQQSNTTHWKLLD